MEEQPAAAAAEATPEPKRPREGEEQEEEEKGNSYFDSLRDDDDDNMEACFKAFDKDEDGSLNINEFTALLKALFRNEKGKPYPLDAHMINEFFGIFNVSGDGSRGRDEFAFCGNGWIKKASFEEGGGFYKVFDLNL